MKAQVVKTYSISSDITSGTVKVSKLDGEIAATSHVTEFRSVVKNGDSLQVWGDSLSDESALDALVLAHVAFSLADCKATRYVEIDAKTGGLISAGFVYDSKTFSLSPNAQANWNSLMDNQSEFNWPVDITTIDNDTYSLEVANISAFWNAAKNVLKGHLDTGRVLKKEIFDATDKTSVDAVVDNR